jgi:hypothetical protein
MTAMAMMSFANRQLQVDQFPLGTVKNILVMLLQLCVAAIHSSCRFAAVGTFASSPSLPLARGAVPLARRMILPCFMVSEKSARRCRCVDRSIPQNQNDSRLGEALNGTAPRGFGHASTGTGEKAKGGPIWD